MAVLLPAQQVAGAAQFQIERGNLESRAQVAEFLQRRQALARNFRQFGIRRHQQIGVSAAIRAAHPAAQLVELRQAVALRIFDDHGVGQRNIQTIFYNRRADEDIDTRAA